MQLRQLRTILPFQRIVFAFLVVIVFIAFNGCSQTDPCSNIARCEMLDSIEAQMFQRPECLDSLLDRVDTMNMTPHEQARVRTIRGLFHFEKGEFDKSISELEKAGTYFFNQQDQYHLHICKLIKAINFEFLNLDHNAADLFVECEDYFNDHNLDKFKFYATLGLFRLAKQLKIDEEIIFARLHKAVLQLDDPNYFGLFNSTIGDTEKNDSLSNIFYERAKLYFTKVNRWSRIYAIDLNTLFMKIRKDPSEHTQLYYDNFNKREHFSTPTVRQILRYKFAQAYLYAHMGKNTHSIEIAQQVLSEAVACKIAKVEWDCVELLSSLYKRTGDFENAHKMIEKIQSLQKERMDALQKNQLLALGAHYRYSELEREKLDLRLKVQKSRIWIGVTILGLFIMVYLFWLSSKKNKREQENLKLEKMNIEDQLNNLLRSLYRQEPNDEKLIRKTKDLENQYADSIKVSELVNSIEQNENIKWAEYEASFHELRPGWVEKLKQIRPELSSIEMSYCMCFYFNLKNKEIAKVLSVGNDAIKSAKKRLRDKFELHDAKELHLYLIDLL